MKRRYVIKRYLTAGEDIREPNRMVPWLVDTARRNLHVAEFGTLALARKVARLLNWEGGAGDAAQAGCVGGTGGDA